MAAGVPCSRYRSVAEAMADPQLAERGFLAELGEGEGRFKCANLPFVLSRTPTRARPLLAALGAHGAEALQQKLGLDEAFFARAHDPAQASYQSTLRLLHYFATPPEQQTHLGLWRAGGA